MFKVIPLDNVKPSKENYRTIFRKVSMEELTASVKSKGVLQPILVRPVKGNGSFEIVAGHRRFMAATDAGLGEIPAMVKELSDVEALEIQVIENSQREDPNPMEEARGFAKLIKMGKHTPDTLAEKIGRSVRYVLSRVKLLDLPEKVQAKVESEELSLGHALLLTRLRHASEQTAFMKEILDEELSVGQATGGIRDFVSTLENAVFDTAGCERCPYLSRNQSTLWPDLKKSDHCMDKGCFFAKTRDHYKAILKARAADGFKTFTDEKTVRPLIAHGAKKSARIVDSESKTRYYYGVEPKKYKGQCMKCTEQHAFYMYETKGYNGKGIEFGDICLDTKCLNKMQGHARPGHDGGNGTSSSGNGHNKEMKARECRDRFLRDRVPPKVAASAPLQKRLHIYYMCVAGNDFMPEDLAKELGLGKSRWILSTELYRGIMALPAKQLDKVLSNVLAAKVAKDTDTGALLLMTDEAGIDVSKELAVDKAWLNSNTKAELAKVAKQLGVKLPAKAEKKGEMVKAILAGNLVGKIPSDFKKVLSKKKG